MYQQAVFVILLDLSAAFDMVNHSLLLSRLQQWCGINGSALAWLSPTFSIVDIVWEYMIQHQTNFV